MTDFTRHVFASFDGTEISYLDSGSGDAVALLLHGFQVDGSTVPTGDGWQVALVNLNDGSVEGLAHRSLPVMTVQFHPEASPGPLDNIGLFDRFLDMVAGAAK